MISTLDLTRLPKEVLLILEVLKDKEVDLKRDFLERLSEEVNWQLFLEYAIHHRVYPTLYRQLKNYKDQLKVPTFIMQSLEQLYKENTFKMLQLSAEMNEIGKFFAERDIDILFLKGPTIAQDLFGDISLRTSKDLDILIPIEQLENVKCILKELGYEQTTFIESLFNEWKWRYKDISFYHPQKQILIEVHWRLFYGPKKEPSFEELWDRRKESTITQNPCYFLGKEDLFYYLVIHGARHGWFRLRWLLDIQQFMKQPLDWQILYKQFKNYKNIILCGQVIILGSELFEWNITDKMKPFLSKRSRKIANSALFFIERMYNLGGDPTLPKNIKKYYRKYSSTLNIFSQRILQIIGYFHPSLADAHFLPLPRPFKSLYFPLRPMIWLSRKCNNLIMSKDEL